jgi:hypothetical protein
LARAITGDDVMAWRRRYRKAENEGHEVYRHVVARSSFVSGTAQPDRAAARRKLLTGLRGLVRRYVEFNSHS